MPGKNASDNTKDKNVSDVLKSWMMVALTLIFVFLYAAALFGWLKPLSDSSMITRLEPIIFVIIGYYFGRLPAQQNEKTLKNEITRQTQKADAAQQVKEQAQQEREALEEKIKNTKIVLTTPARAPEESIYESMGDESTPAGGQNRYIDAAVNILNS